MTKLHKIAFALAVGVAQFIAGQASAEVVTFTRDGAGGFSVFVPGDAPVGSNARIIGRAGSYASERSQRWLAYCKPTVTTDSLGVEHLNYAKAGCEFGRDHD
jgi:hypothetical protein